MNREKKRLSLPLIVEGRYDKCTLSSLFSGLIITLDGFSVFNSKEKQATLRKVGEKGVILLTDSDGAGRQIRSYLSKIIPGDRLHHLYIPEIEGKERRKRVGSKAGFLGVEGMGRAVLEKLFAPYIDTGACDANEDNAECKMLTKLDLYNDGLSGGEDSSQKRGLVAERLGLPKTISARALLEAINVSASVDEYREAVKEIFGD